MASLLLPALVATTPTITKPPASAILSNAALAFRGVVTPVRWQLDLIREQKRPMRLGVDVEVRENSKGRGLYALRTIEKGALVGRYTGRTLTTGARASSTRPSHTCRAITLNPLCLRVCV